jgi:Flp pilus assembly protein TadG
MPPFHPEVVPAPLRLRERGRKQMGARGRRRPLAWRAHLAGEEGNAVVEFVFLGVVLLVPVVYLVLTVGQLQGGSFAVVGAADQAAKVYVDAPTPQAADARARQAVRIALSDFGFSEDQAAVHIACSEECLAPGSTVTVVVRLEVPLPLIPGIAGSHASAATVDATSTQLVERFG